MPQLLVDCGDFGSTLSDAARTKVSYLLRGMAEMKYDAINLAERDLQYGIDYIREMRDRYNLPFISANVYLAGQDKLFAPPYVIKKMGDLKVGIVGVVKPPANKRMITAAQGFEIRDPFSAAAEVVRELKGKCDVIVTLSHLGFEGSKQLATDLPEIDLVVSGHGRNLSRSPLMLGNTCLMQPGSKGKYLGQIDVQVADGEVQILQARMVSLNRSIADDAQLANLVHEYDTRTAAPKTGTN